MDPVGHYDHPVRRKFHEGRQFFGAVPAARVCTFPLKAERTQRGEKHFSSRCAGFQDFPSSFPSSEKQDARLLSKSEFKTVPSGSDCVRRPVEDAALRNLQLENLRKAIAELDVQGQNLLSLRYSDALTMDEIGQIYGISKMAVSKRLKKLHEKLGSPVMRQSFPAFLKIFSVLWFTNAL